MVPLQNISNSSDFKDGFNFYPIIYFVYRTDKFVNNYISYLFGGIASGHLLSIITKTLSP